MALDNAEFISELSITDPPGTDPINQGDDHIRTTKRATQQSFPNVDAPVPQTAAQMAQMAIKNEVNTFSQSNTFQSVLQVNSNGLRCRATNTGDVTGIIFQSSPAGITRWQIFRADDNSGFPDFEVRRLNTSGIFQGTEFSIAASSGRYTFDKVGFHKGGADMLDETGDQQIALSWSDPTNSWSMLSENTGADGLAASTFRFRRFINGAPAGNIFTILNSNGQTTWDQSMHMIAPNIRFTMSDTGAGSSKLEQGLLSDNSGFIQGRTPAGSVSWLFRGDVNGQNYVGAFTAGAKFGIRTSTPARTFDVVGEGATAMRITGLPLSNAGLSSGDCFQSGGFIAIVP